MIKPPVDCFGGLMVEPGCSMSVSGSMFQRSTQCDRLGRGFGKSAGQGVNVAQGDGWCMPGGVVASATLGRGCHLEDATTWIPVQCMNLMHLSGSSVR